MDHHKICILLYSHSDYSDVWDVCFGQIYKYINLDDIEKYFCICSGLYTKSKFLDFT